MICPHCGNNVPNDADICKHCGKPTQFSLKFDYRPSSAPISKNSVKPEEHSSNDTKGTFVTSKEITRAINNALPSKHTIQLWFYKYIGISLLAIALSIAVSLIAFSSSNHRMKQTIESLRPTPTIWPTLSPSLAPAQSSAITQIRFERNMPENVKEDQLKDFPNSETKTVGSPLNLNAEPRIEGYLFTGWNTKEDGKGVSFPRDSILSFNPDSEVLTLFAQWVRVDADSTLIVFDANLPESKSMVDLTNLPDEVQKLPNEPISLIQKPTLTGYSFVEWNTEKKGTGMSIKNGSTININLDMETLTLYAQWE